MLKIDQYRSHCLILEYFKILADAEDNLSPQQANLWVHDRV